MYMDTCRADEVTSMDAYNKDSGQKLVNDVDLYMGQPLYFWITNH